MAYIGNQPTDNFVTFATQNFSTSATSSYTLSHAVSNENEIALFINNVRQHPGSGKAYTASGTALTLSANTASTDVMYCIFLGRAIQSTVPATNSITAAMVSANAVTGAKLNTDVISAQTALAAEPADTDEFLVSDAGVLKRIDYSLIKGGGITEADMWNKKDSDQTISGDTSTLVTGWSRVNGTGYGKLGTGLSESSDIFSFPSTGYYLIGCGITFRDNANNSYMNNQIRVTTDNSNYSIVSQATQFQTADGSTNLFTSAYTQYLLDVTNVSNVKFKITVFGQSAFVVDTDSDRASCFITSIRLGDT